MMDIISKVIGILLAFALLVIAPLTINTIAEDAVAQRIALNEVERFLDRVSDKASISGNDISDLMLGINTYGSPYDVHIYRYITVVSREANYILSYDCLLSDDNFDTLAENSEIVLNSSDIIQVRVKSVGTTKGAKLLGSFIGFPSNCQEFSLSVSVK